MTNKPFYSLKVKKKINQWQRSNTLHAVDNVELERKFEKELGGVGSSIQELPSLCSGNFPVYPTLNLKIRFPCLTHLFDSAETADEADEDDEDARDDEDVGHGDVEVVAQQHLDVRLVHHRPYPHAEHQEAARLKTEVGDNLELHRCLW